DHRQCAGRDRQQGSRTQCDLRCKACDAGSDERVHFRCSPAAEKGRSMIESSIALDELERDALTELVNIGVSRAAASLRKMVHKQVILSVPSVEIVTRQSAASLIGQRESERLVAVQQQFEGPFSGRALLIFPESNGLSLVRAIVG